MNRTLKKHSLDKKFLIIVFILLAVGVTTFISSSLSVYSESTTQFYAMMVRHIGLGVIGGLFTMFVMSHIHFSVWKKMSPYIYILGIIVTLLVFSPLGFSHGGASRWISLGLVSFQPAELLKFSVILFFAAWYAQHEDKIKTLKYGFVSLIGFLAVPLFILTQQPDSSTIVLIAFVAFVIYFLRGAKLSHILIALFLGATALGAYMYMNPHTIERFQTFRDPMKDPLGSGYQVRQAEIAIGSGKLFGRGLGQSVHKFGGLIPEPYSDSIFAIYAEEYGFIGGGILILLYGLLAFFGLRIARYAPTPFAQNLVIGIILLIVVQVFLNIAAMSKLVPLSGFPLIFMSNGGTALLVTLAEIGIILNISRYTRIPIKKNKNRI